METLPNETTFEIFNLLDTRSICKLSETQWNYFNMSQDIRDKRQKFEENHLLKLLKLFPDKKWDYLWLSGNPNISWDYINSNLEKPWNYYWIAQNRSIPWSIINETNLWPVADQVVCERKYSLSKNPNITWQIVKNNPNFNWDYDGLSQNPNITWDIVQNSLDKPWDYVWLSGHPNIKWHHIKNNPDRKWNEHFMCKSKDPDIIRNIFDHSGLNMYTISKNMNITIDDYFNYPNKDWSLSGLSKNPNITIEIVKKYPKIKWDHSKLSRNCNITMKIVKENPEIRWDHDQLSRNCNITWKDVVENDKIKWNFASLSRNKFNKDPFFGYIPKVKSILT